LLELVIDDIINIIAEQLHNCEEIKARYDEHLSNFEKEKKRIREKTSV
jgi:hypothetical protein